MAEQTENFIDKEIESSGTKNGLEIWRVQKEKLVRLPQICFGTFYEEEAYILLRTYNIGKKLTISLHYWLGSKASIQITNAACMFCAQFYNYHATPCTQYREIQGCEGEEFLKYFKHGLVYLEGGVPATDHVFESLPHFDVKRLLVVTNQLPAKAREVAFEWSSFNNCAVMLIDIGNIIAIWKGSKSTVQNANKALSIAEHIKESEREGLAQIHTLQISGNEKDKEILESLLGPTPETIEEDLSQVETTKIGDETSLTFNVFVLKGENGKVVELNEEKFPPILNKRSLLKDEVYLFDVHSHQKIFVWKGFESEQSVKSVVWNVVSDYMQQANSPASTQVQIIDDGSETEDFTDLFNDWEKDKLFDRRYSLYPQKLEKPPMPGNGEGKLEVFLMTNRHLIPVSEKHHGRFYSLECYIVRFTYDDDGREGKIIYYWEGRRDSPSPSGNYPNPSPGSPEFRSGPSGHIPTVRLEGATECRVEVGKEPTHFVAFFKGKFIIMKGTDPLSTNPSKVLPPNRNKVPGVTLYIVKGNNEFNTKAIQVPCSASSLNCNYPFICTTPRSVYIWFGKGCIGDQRDMAHLMADNLKRERNLVAMEEGREHTRLFAALGGRKPYLDIVVPKEPEVTRFVRTYQCGIDHQGEPVFSEIYDLEQKDLTSNDVILVDVFDEIYIWLGSKVGSRAATQCFQMGLGHLGRCRGGRGDMKTPILVVKQGYEPSTFTRYFTTWDQAKNIDTKETRLTSDDVKRLLVNRYALPTFTYDELRGGCPQGVNPEKKEKYLSEQDFLSVFRMTREDFARKSEWTRTDLKKKNGLF